jgi:SAM-dependent methyltransferase
VSEGFDRLYLVAKSAAYRDAVRSSLGDLPGWLVPFSTISLHLLERIASVLSIGPASTFLDFACGNGAATLWVAERTGASAVGIDFAATAIASAEALARQRRLASKTRFVVADVTDSNLPAGSFDGLMSIDALMFVDADAAVKEMHRVLRRGAVVSLTSVESLGEPVIPTLVPDHRPVFERHGFEIVAWEHPMMQMERSRALHRALLERSEALRSEVGSAAEELLAQAKEMLERREPRARPVFVVARRKAGVT